MEERKRIDVLLNGLIKENPVLVLVIGTCPTLATSTSVETGFGMGLAATAVLRDSSRSSRCSFRHLYLPCIPPWDCTCP